MFIISLYLMLLRDYPRLYMCFLHRLRNQDATKYDVETKNIKRDRPNTKFCMIEGVSILGSSFRPTCLLSKSYMVS